MSDVRVASWSALIERLYDRSWQSPLGRFRANSAYRGMSDASVDLRTTLQRLGSPPERVEGHLLRNFRKYAHRDSASGDSIWNWLALGQHHQLPTRLLDWTYSPTVALHFATYTVEEFHLDGIVWRVDYVKAHALLPPKLREVLEDEEAEVFTTEMLGRASRSLHELEQLAEKPFAVFFEPPSLDDRIVNQFAMFSLMSTPLARLDEWLADHPEVYERVIIPAALKWEIRDKLDQANITERVLFPGLDGLSQWLARYYTPRDRRNDGSPGSPSRAPSQGLANDQ